MSHLTDHIEALQSKLYGIEHSNVEKVYDELTEVIKSVQYTELKLAECKDENKRIELERFALLEVMFPNLKFVKEEPPKPERKSLGESKYWGDE